MPPENTQTAPAPQDITLSSLFELGSSPLAEEHVGAGMDVQELADIRKKIANLPVPVSWQVAEREISSALSGMTQASLLDTWAEGWSTYTDLMKEVEVSRKSPASTATFPIAKHKIETTLSPHVDVYIGPKLVQQLKFDVTLTTRLSGIILHLKGGAVEAITIGGCAWEGSICIRKITLLSKSLTELHFPGQIRLTPPHHLGHPKG